MCFNRNKHGGACGKRTKRHNATIEEQYGLARESFEPQTAAENYKLIVSDSARSRRCLASHHEFPRSLTNNDALESSGVNVHTTVDLRPLQHSSKWTQTTGLRERVRRVQWLDTDHKLVTGSWCIVTTGRRIADSVRALLSLFW